MTDVRAIAFDERDAAEAFVDTLTDHGRSGRLHRDEFAGEDDAEDAAWVVEVDRLTQDVIAWAHESGGWPLREGGDVVQTTPLPQSPQRLKRDSAPRRVAR